MEPGESNEDYYNNVTLPFQAKTLLQTTKEIFGKECKFHVVGFSLGARIAMAAAMSPYLHGTNYYCNKTICKALHGMHYKLHIVVNFYTKINHDCPRGLKPCARPIRVEGFKPCCNKHIHLQRIHGM